MKAEMLTMLDDNILNFWLTQMTDHEGGGFYGRADALGRVEKEAPRGAVLNARILWAFSAAYRVTGNEKYLEAATWAKEYFTSRFIDHLRGGVFWCLDHEGEPTDTKKQTYAIGFAIYGLSEYARATGDDTALQAAVALYRDIERHAYDAVANGYTEALTREWKPIGDMRLSEKDENMALTMNTHLHILEPYTNLYRVWRDETLRQRIVNLIDIFLTHILNPETGHLDLFFDAQWQGRRNMQSYGHDIEAVWLLHEAALVVGLDDVTARVEAVLPRIARAADEGLQPDGSMIYERHADTGEVDAQRQWWVMCECVIGHIDLYQYFGDHQALDVALHCWDYIKQNLVDREHGEWYWGRLADGSIDLENDKAGFWKCPYHNTRMCLEVMERDM